MRQWHGTKSGGTAASLWVCGGVAVVCLCLAGLYPWQALFGGGAVCAAAVFYGRQLAAHTHAEIKNGVFTLRQGQMLPTVQHLPVHSVTGVSLAQTPVQRITHTAFLTVAGAGGRLVTAALNYADAVAVQRCLTGAEGKPC